MRFDPREHWIDSGIGRKHRESVLTDICIIAHADDVDGLLFHVITFGYERI